MAFARPQKADGPAKGKPSHYVPYGPKPANPVYVAPGMKIKLRAEPEPQIASVPFMITRRIRADLHAAGYTEDQIKGMTPTEALARLGYTTPCPRCRAAVPIDQLCSTPEGQRCRTCAGVDPEPVETTEDLSPAETRAQPTPTPTQAAQLSKLGVHPEVIKELTPAKAKSLLTGDPPIIPRNAAQAPKDDLHELAKALGTFPMPSADLAALAVQYGGGVAITADMIDAIKAGGWAPFMVRNAIWVALS